MNDHVNLNSRNTNERGPEEEEEEEEGKRGNCTNGANTTRNKVWLFFAGWGKAADLYN